MAFYATSLSFCCRVLFSFCSSVIAVQSRLFSSYRWLILQNSFCICLSVPADSLVFRLFVVVVFFTLIVFSSVVSGEKTGSRKTTTS